MTVLPTASVCINNYNYAEYVGRAVQSALDQTADGVEVIVVDDGSTDDSLDRLEEFGDRITVIAQENGGMARAMNRAYEVARADHVFFLDSDDFFEPDCIERVLGALTPGYAKAHWRFRLVDRDGVRFGVNPPLQVPLAAGDVADELCRTGTYSTVPTSANCYSRATLERLMPVPEEDFRFSGDSYLNLGAPLLGPVVAVEELLSCYRVHDRNANAARGRFEGRLLKTRLRNARAQDEWLPRLAQETGRTAAAGAVLGQPEFRLMTMLDDRAASNPPSTGRQLRAGFGLTVAAARTRSLHRRRRLMLAGVGPLLPLLPRPWVEHVQDVAFGGKPMRPLPARK